MNLTHLKLSFLISGFLFCVDQFLKHLARLNPALSYYIWKPWLGWEYFANKGIAFSLPFPNILLIGLITAIIIGLIFWSVKKREPSPAFYFALFFIIFGAMSNLIDRVFFSATIDYFRLFTGVINLADVMVVVGVLILLIEQKFNKN